MFRTIRSLVLLSIFAALLVGPSVYAGTIDLAQSSWDAKKVVLRITDVPKGTKAVVCVYDNGGCEIKSAAVSAPAGDDGVVWVIVPTKGKAFKADDTVRISDPDCAILVVGGGLADADCAAVCPDCEPDEWMLPSLTAYGLVALVVLLAISGIWIYRRRRVTTTA